MVPFVLSPMSASSPPAPSPHDTGVYPARTYLFLDDLHVARMVGLRRVTGAVEHVADGPVLEPEAPWEGLGLIGRNCILWDAEASRFKCWYPAYDPALPDAPVGARRRWAYAESRDGLSWERPSLGLTEFAGSTANNLLRLEGVGESAAVLWSIAKDTRDPDPARRYKAIGLDRHPLRPGELTWTGPDGEDEWYRTHGRHLACGVYVAYSADGVTWRQRQGWAGSGALITDNTILHGWDSATGRWVLWQRPRIMPKHRVIGVSFSADFDDWTFPECVLAPDRGDPPGTQFDQLSTVAASDGAFVGLLSASAVVREDRGVMSVVPQLVYSRDGAAMDQGRPGAVHPPAAAPRLGRRLHHPLQSAGRRRRRLRLLLRQERRPHLGRAHHRRHAHHPLGLRAGDAAARPMGGAGSCRRS